MTALANAQTLGDAIRGQATVQPHKTAVQSLGRAQVTFETLNARINRLNHACAALGMRKGDRAGILSPNRPEYVEVYGLAKSGIIVVPLNWRLTPSELASLLVHSAPRILFVDQAYVPTVNALRSNLGFVETCVSFGHCNGFVNYEALLGDNVTTEPVTSVSAADPLCLLYTSGTTGSPKGVVISHAGALGNARSVVNEVLHLTESDHAMAVMPLFHAGGMWYHLFPSLAAGCTTLILSEFEPATILREIATRRISNVHLVPTMIGALLAHPDFAARDLRCLRMLFYAASSMPAELLRRAIKALPECAFIQCYGSTEAGVVTVLGANDHRRAAAGDQYLLHSCGKPLAICHVQITDAKGGSLAPGCVGEIEVASPNVMDRYWKDPAATTAAMNGRFVKTGDLGKRDEEGFVYIIDRKNDMIVTGGENVFPTEVEDALFGDPDILEAAVFGIPDSVWVEKVVAAVVLNEHSQVTSDVLISRLKAKLASYKCPKVIYIRENLPKNAVGKILRKELRREYGSNG